MLCFVNCRWKQSKKTVTQRKIGRSWVLTLTEIAFCSIFDCNPSLYGIISCISQTLYRRVTSYCIAVQSGLWRIYFFSMKLTCTFGAQLVPDSRGCCACTLDPWGRSHVMLCGCRRSPYLNMDLVLVPGERLVFVFTLRCVYGWHWCLPLCGSSRLRRRSKLQTLTPFSRFFAFLTISF